MAEVFARWAGVPTERWRETQPLTQADMATIDHESGVYCERIEWGPPRDPVPAGGNVRELEGDGDEGGGSLHRLSFQLFIVSGVQGVPPHWAEEPCTDGRDARERGSEARDLCPGKRCPGRGPLGVLSGSLSQVAPHEQSGSPVPHGIEKKVDCRVRYIVVAHIKYAEAEETADQGASEAGGICGPGVRWGHTCNAVRGGRYLYVFGGYGRDNCQTNDVHVFDTGGWWPFRGACSLALFSTTPFLLLLSDFG
ncbi:hypothetical protein BHE74_00029936 [Ensete ventricosum]|nr:hypothetical protein BHE74_00029936 [Ensete ventricosum]